MTTFKEAFEQMDKPKVMLNKRVAKFQAGQKHATKKGLIYTIIEMVQKSPRYKYLIRFDETGGEKIVDRKQIETGSIADDYDPHIYGVAYRGSIKCISKLEKKAFSNWHAMISRCYNNKDINYGAYGGNGVTVNERWLCFKNFYEDLPYIEGFEEEAYLLGRINLDKEYVSLENKTYSLETCGYISASANKKKKPSIQTRIVASKGTTIIEFTNLTEFCKEHKLKDATVRKALREHRVYKGWRFKEKHDIMVFVSKATEWDLVLDMARLTVNKDRLYKIPTNAFKKRILLAEHSPIRTLQYVIEIKNIPSWVSQHIARHDAFANHTVRDSNGDVHFVGTARTDRTGIDRNDLPQDAPVNHTIYCNANDLINISTKRLCACASKETREVWIAVKDAIERIDESMASVMVPSCVYRGFCPEGGNSCGYDKTQIFQIKLKEYRRIDDE